jgi:SAM-dependent methyltransferase
MEAATYAVEAVVERTHWWFVGRRRLFAGEIAALGLPADARILDIGTSTGTNLRMLNELGYRRVTGLDLSEEAIRYCEAKGLGPVRQGDICALPFEAASFDLILATDIIEHVEDDGAALREVERTLTARGKLLLTVPAFASLWGLQDDVARHLRRYRMRPLIEAIRMAGFEPLRSYHFNYLLFAPIWLVRRIIGALGIKLGSEAEVNTPLLNTLMTAVFRIDLMTAPRLRPPFGVSIMVVAQKRGADGDSP